MEAIAGNYQLTKEEQTKWSVKAFLSEKWDGHLRDLPKNYLVSDALLSFEGDMLRAWVNIEFHANNVAMHIPADKYLRGLELSERSGYPFVTVHAYDNGDVWYMKVDKPEEKTQIGWRGEVARFGKEEEEYPCIYFKHNHMKLFKTSEDF